MQIKMKKDYFIASLVVVVLAYFPFVREDFGSARDASDHISEAKAKPVALYFEKDGHLRIETKYEYGVLKSGGNGDYRLFEFKDNEFEMLVDRLAEDGWKYEKLFTTRHWGSVGLLYWLNFPPWEVKHYRKNADTLAWTINRVIWKYKIRITCWYWFYCICVYAFAYLVQYAEEQSQEKKRRKRLVTVLRRIEQLRLQGGVSNQLASLFSLGLFFQTGIRSKVSDILKQFLKEKSS